MRDDYKLLVNRMRVLCVSWSITFFFIGLALAFLLAYECNIRELLGGQILVYIEIMSAVSFSVSTLLSISFYLLRKRREKLGDWQQNDLD